MKGSILNLVDANYVDSDSKNPQRQLYGYSIAAKRYALYERVSDNDIKIVDPKAHGIGFLYPPKDSPKDVERRRSPMDLRNVGLHCTGRSKTETQKTILAQYPADDAP